MVKNRSQSTTHRRQADCHMHMTSEYSKPMNAFCPSHSPPLTTSTHPQLYHCTCADVSQCGYHRGMSHGLPGPIVAGYSPPALPSLRGPPTLTASTPGLSSLKERPLANRKLRTAVGREAPALPL